MISVVICSVSKVLLDNVKSNIQDTIGVPCEILSYNNGVNAKGICEIYNQGAIDAKYGIICYMHEDVIINTNEWGQYVIQAFKDNPRLGVLGVAGTTYKPWMPSGWGHAGLSELNLYRINIIQHFKNQEKPAEHVYENPNNEELARVACVDGVWFCTSKIIAQTYPFNHDLLKGFHCYDVDFSVAVGQKFHIAVTYEILLEHFSEGKFDKNWLNDVIDNQEYREKLLPVNVEGVSKSQIQKIEKRVFKDLIKHYSRFNLSKMQLFKLPGKARKARIINNFLCLRMYYYLIRSL